MRAISTFNLEDGRSTRGCFARAALRIRVSISAMGSVVILPSLPTGLHHAGNFSLEREAAETDAAHFKFAQETARAAADPAAVAPPDLVLELTLHLRELTGSSHALSLSLSPERYAEQLQQLAPFFVGAGRRRDRDVHALDLVDSCVINLREHQLILDAQRVVPAAVERIGR